MEQDQTKRPVYVGRFMSKIQTDKDMKKHYTHPIFLYSLKNDTEKGDIFEKLNQIVNVYEHSLEDFVCNSKKIINHFKRYYGDRNTGMYTLGQSISFRVYKGQEEPFSLSLFAFFVNYTMLLVPILLHVDLHDWTPWTHPKLWTAKAWENIMNQYIKRARPYGNNRKIGEYIEWSKYLMNLFAVRAGDRLAISISNLDFLEVAKRSKDAYESMTCTFPIPKNVTPSELEMINKKRTEQLMNIISEQTDLPLSIYTKNNLFNSRQFQEYAVHMGYKPDLYGNTIPITSNTNIIMGLNDPAAFMVDAYGGRKAEIIKLYVSDAGALERSLCMLMSGVRFVDINYECDSKHFRKRYIDSVDTLEKLDGRVCTLDPNSDKYWIIDPDDTQFIGKTIYLKTPITCTHPRLSLIHI